MSVDRNVRDLSWKIANGVLYNAKRLISFGYQYPPSFFCCHHLKSSEHQSSPVLFQSGLDWIQFLCFLSSPAPPFISVSLRTIFFVCLGFLPISLDGSLVWAQQNDYRFRSEPICVSSMCPVNDIHVSHA